MCEWVEGSGIRDIPIVLVAEWIRGGDGERRGNFYRSKGADGRLFLRLHVRGESEKFRFFLCCRCAGQVAGHRKKRTRNLEEKVDPCSIREVVRVPQFGYCEVRRIVWVSWGHSQGSEFRERHFEKPKHREEASQYYGLARILAHLAVRPRQRR